MNKNFLASIEFSSLYINIVVCSYRNDKLDVVAASRTRNAGYFYGNIVDEEAFDSALKDALASIKKRFNIDVDEAILVLPSANHHIYKAEVSRDVETDGRIVNQKEIDILANRIRRAKVGAGEALIEDVKVQYVLDSNREYRTAPLGQKSSTLGLVCNVHTIPSEIVSNIERVLKNNNITILGKLLDVSSGAYINSKPYFLEEESVCINIGYDVTTISCFLKSTLLACGNVEFGINSLVSYLAKNLNVDFDSALKLFESYFICNIDLTSSVVFDKENNLSEKRISGIVLNRLNNAFKEIIDKLVYLTHSNQCTFNDDFKILVSGSLNDYEGFIDLFSEYAGSDIVEGGISIPMLKYQSFNNAYGAIMLFLNRNQDYMKHRLEDDVTITPQVVVTPQVEEKQVVEEKVNKEARFRDFFDD